MDLAHRVPFYQSITAALSLINEVKPTHASYLLSEKTLYRLLFKRYPVLEYLSLDAPKLLNQASKSEW